MRLEGKVAIVAGAAWGGIGGATALRFAQEGARVVVNTRSREGKMEETLQRIRDAGGECVGVMGDASEEATWQTLVQTALDHYGKLTTLVFNAAQSFVKPAIEFTMEEWNRALGVSLTGPFIAAKHCIPEMIKAGGGAIVLISTVNSYITNPGFAVYGASKGGLNMLSRTIALDYGDRGIRCNAIAPGQVVGERGAAFYAQDKLEDWAAKECYPRREYGRPLEIANAALFLASDEASFVTGVLLPVDGGLTIQSPEALVRPSFRRTWRPYTLVPKVVTEEERHNFSPPPLPEGFTLGDEGVDALASLLKDDKPPEPEK